MSQPLVGGFLFFFDRVPIYRACRVTFWCLLKLKEEMEG